MLTGVYEGNTKSPLYVEVDAHTGNPVYKVDIPWTIYARHAIVCGTVVGGLHAAKAKARAVLIEALDVALVSPPRPHHGDAGIDESDAGIDKSDAGLDESDAPDTYIAAVWAEDGWRCQGCAFEDTPIDLCPGCAGGGGLRCSGRNRRDGYSVIFKKKG